MKYRVISSVHLDEFERLVEERLNDGWECVGGISAVYKGSYMEYYQSMTKTEKKSDYNPNLPMAQPIPFRINIENGDNVIPMRVNEIRFKSI